MHPDVEDILETTRCRASDAERVLDSVECREFFEPVRVVKDDGRNPVIAEVKPTSPTTDGVNGDDPVAVAECMVQGGAVAVSVLTEPNYFGGSLDTLREVREAVDVPVLRKDFILERSQLYEVEADLMLLIAAFLEPAELDNLVDEALSIGFEPLVEVHTLRELRVAVDTGARVIGVNNRDLRGLEVDLSVGESLLPEVPDDCVAVSESGISSPVDVRRLRGAGADAFLVGSSIMGSDDVRGRTRELVDA